MANNASSTNAPSAHIVTPTIILDSPKSILLHVYIESDGVSSDLVNYPILDPQLDFADSPQKVQMSVRQVWCGMSWFDVFLSFDDTTPYPSFLLARDTVGYHDFRYFGGLKDRSDLDGTGKLLISTNGLTPAGSRGTLVIELQKNKQS